jgi:hypothetical protein
VQPDERTLAATVSKRSALTIGKKTGGGTATTTKSNEPWKAIQPDLTSMYTHARQAGGRPMEFFPTQTYANNSYETNLAQDLQRQRGMNGSSVTDAMQGELTKTLGGDYLMAGNPYFSAMSDRIGNEVTKNYNSTFGGGGRWGSGAHAQGLGSGLSDAIGGLAYQNYGDERGRMMQASAMAPAAANQDYFDIAKVAEVGAQKDAMEQQGIDEAMARHEFQYAEPWNRLGNWNSILSGGMNFGTQTGTTRQPTQRSSLGADLLGGGMLGLSLLGGPVGPAIAGGASALSGIFGRGGASPMTAMAGPGGLFGGRV